MTGSDQSGGAGPAIDWQGDTPVSRAHGDPYHTGGLDETRHVFLAGNGLPARFRPGFRIAETGFGTGLNLAAALIAWRTAGVRGPLAYTAFEIAPLPAAAMARALAPFPAAAAALAPLLAVWDSGARRFAAGDLDLTVIVGDARQTLPAWDGCADAWFLDGFAPAKNPELWEPALLAAVARHTAPGGTAATYTAAGHVRRALQAAGFRVERAPGFGRKRHMTTARLP